MFSLTLSVPMLHLHILLGFSCKPRERKRPQILLISPQGLEKKHEETSTKNTESLRLQEGRSSRSVPTLPKAQPKYQRTLDIPTSAG